MRRKNVSPAERRDSSCSVAVGRLPCEDPRGYNSWNILSSFRSSVRTGFPRRFQSPETIQKRFVMRLWAPPRHDDVANKWFGLRVYWDETKLTTFPRDLQRGDVLCAAFSEIRTLLPKYHCGGSETCAKSDLRDRSVYSRVLYVIITHEICTWHNGGRAVRSNTIVLYVRANAGTVNGLLFFFVLIEKKTENLSGEKNTREILRNKRLTRGITRIPKKRVCFLRIDSPEIIFRLELKTTKVVKFYVKKNLNTLQTNQMVLKKSLKMTRFCASSCRTKVWRMYVVSKHDETIYKKTFIKLYAYNIKYIYNESLCKIFWCLKSMVFY